MTTDHRSRVSWFDQCPDCNAENAGKRIDGGRECTVCGEVYLPLTGLASNIDGRWVVEHCVSFKSGKCAIRNTPYALDVDGCRAEGADLMEFAARVLTRAGHVVTNAL